jgi:hypothetical protein
MSLSIAGPDRRRKSTGHQVSRDHDGKGSQVELAGVITGTIKLLIGIGVVIGLIVAFLLVKLFGSRS